MIFTAWIRFRYFLQFLFTRDPMVEWMDRTTAQYESRILNLNKILDERNATIYDLQNELINILRPRPEVTPQVVEMPVGIRGGWAAQRNHLEDLNSRKRREEILAQVSKREAEIEEALNTPGADILSPALDR